jgi:hypothetical protein
MAAMDDRDAWLEVADEIAARLDGSHLTASDSEITLAICEQSLTTGSPDAGQRCAEILIRMLAYEPGPMSSEFEAIDLAAIEARLVLIEEIVRGGSYE